MKQLNKLFNRYPVLKTIYNIVLFIGGTFLFIYLVENLGLFKSAALYLLFFLAIFVYKMYGMKDIIMYNIRQMETRQFGKPLDRDKWKHGELNKKKLKIVWRKPGG